MLFLCALAVVVAGRAETSLLKSLSPEEFAAAGLGKQTPSELAKLEEIMQRIQAGAVAVVEEKAEAKVAAVKEAAATQVAVVTKEAATKVAAAEAKAKESADTENVGGEKKPSWFKALLTLKRARENPKASDALESTLVGDFRGWSGATLFTLADGSRWMQQNRTETFTYSPAMHSPKVRVYPASFSGYWLEVEGGGGKVRVVPFEAK